ncbi:MULTISPECIES: gamma-glutamylcyclotransferase family protein [Thermoanaerobacterium]|uniref:AIG2 family protein n=2 Tax=Thermoanaerobacterium TaxID=28895 RepID=W9EAI1_9THEO|nr:MULTISPECIES: gamma-glutamylcyclotransferase family protein [Thermoanaerobacterium]AFK85861.1 AIG2 family protein [Thermoanaerobacterium saccharolyticum JW/SL-YS485]ETO37930.1 AIG2 family protein [Thermoanaerobacterium aotearoense SCUT27]
MWYFAYGSNMDKERMEERGVNFSERKHGFIKGWKLVFNKVASENPIKGYANIEKDDNDIVEGVLYQIEKDGLEILDKKEGVPNHYIKEKLEVWLENEGKVLAYVYIANKDKVKDGLKPSQEYLNHLLKGCDLLSEKYCDKIKNIKTIE